MARARMLKPSFFRNEELCELPMEGRLLFAGLWTIADREGRLEYRVKRIKADIFPYDDVNVAEHLTKLETNEFVTVYEVDGIKYIQINNFKKHQHPHPNEPKSLIPTPPVAKQCHDITPTLQNNVLPVAKTSESIPSESIPSESLASPARPGDATAESFEEKTTHESPHSDPAEKTEDDWQEFRAAWAALEKWSIAVTRYPLRRGANLERDVWGLIAALANEPPVIHGGQQTPQRFLIPQAVEALIGENVQWKNGSLKYACRCVINKLEGWAKQGAPNGQPQQPTKKSDGTGGYEANKKANQNLQNRMDALRKLHPDWDVNKLGMYAASNREIA